MQNEQTETSPVDNTGISTEINKEASELQEIWFKNVLGDIYNIFSTIRSKSSAERDKDNSEGLFGDPFSGISAACREVLLDGNKIQPDKAEPAISHAVKILTLRALGAIGKPSKENADLLASLTINPGDNVVAPIPSEMGSLSQTAIWAQCSILGGRVRGLRAKVINHILGDKEVSKDAYAEYVSEISILSRVIEGIQYFSRLAGDSYFSASEDKAGAYKSSAILFTMVAQVLLLETFCILTGSSRVAMAKALVELSEWDKKEEMINELN